MPFFIFGDYPPYLGCIEYLDRAFGWAEKYKIKILIDLHTVPDGQNGFDNGGICGVCKWHKNPAHVEFALTVLEQLTVRYRGRPALWGIEVLNEPISQELWDVIDLPNRYPPRDPEYARGSEPVPTGFLKDFYTAAYRRIRAQSDDVTIVFHDGFRIREWDGFFTSPQFGRIIVDTHLYLMEYTQRTGDESPGGYLGHIRDTLTPSWRPGTARQAGSSGTTSCSSTAPTSTAGTWASQSNWGTCPKASGRHDSPAAAACHGLAARAARTASRSFFSQA